MMAFTLLITLCYAIWAPNIEATSNSSKIPTVHILQVHSQPFVRVAIKVGLDVFKQRFPWRDNQIHISLEQYPSKRNYSQDEPADIVMSLRAIIDAANAKAEQNQTFLYALTFDGLNEAKIGGFVTTLYNLVTISGTSISEDLSDPEQYPHHYRNCPSYSDLNEAQRVFVRLLNFEDAGSIITDEWTLTRARYLEGLLTQDRVPIVASHLLSQENIDDVARSLLRTTPAVLLLTVPSFVAPQAICKLYKRGLGSDSVVYMLSGTVGFYRMNWWEPLPGEKGWECTRQEMLEALNGSITVDMYTEVLHQNETEIARRVDKLDNAQVIGLMRRAMDTLPLAEQSDVNDLPSLYSYDAMFASLFALYTSAERLEKEHGYSVNELHSMFDDKFLEFVDIYRNELTKTSFYGATGRVSISESRHSGQSSVRLAQMQSDVDGTYEWVPIGALDITAKTRAIYDDKVRFATETGEPPDIVKRRTAANSRRLFIILISCGTAVVLILAVLIGFCLVRRARGRAWSDLTWLIDEQRVAWSTSARASKSSASLLTSTQDMNASLSLSNSIGSGRHPSMLGLETLGTFMLDSSIPVYLRQLKKPAGLPSLAGLAASRLNLVIFPEARSMFSVVHDNVNRFYGIHYSARKTVTTFNALYAFHSKGSIRNLLGDPSLTLEQEMKLLFLTDVVNGLIALHAKVGAHGFLHSDNLLLDERYTVKITDCGMQKFREPTELMPIIVTDLDEDYILKKLLFRAPELLREGYQAKNVLTTKCDVYSFGMVAFEILTRQTPFSSAIDGYGVIISKNAASVPRETAVTILDEILRESDPPKRPQITSATVGRRISSIDTATTNGMSKPLQELLQNCWQDAAIQRPPLSQVMKAIKHLPDYRSGNVMQNLVKRLEKYAKNLQTIVDERTQALSEEMKRSESLLLQILPRSVANELRRGRQVPPETFSSVSIYFSDIADFASISSNSTPIQVVTFLNEVYTTFDSILSRFDVYKVETIGDSYMVASGVPHPNGYQHCVELARMSLALMEHTRTKFVIPHRPAQPLSLRIGLHTGACVAGVVGLKMPRYCLFGDTVNMASRMESNGKPYKIHTSEQYYLTTNKCTETVQPGQFVFERRGELEVKGKGTVTTYWLLKEVVPSVAPDTQKNTLTT